MRRVALFVLLIAGCSKSSETTVATVTTAPAGTQPSSVSSGPAVAPEPHAKPDRKPTRPSKESLLPEPIYQPGESALASGATVGYAPVIEDVIAALDGKKETGRVVVTLKDRAHKSSRYSEFICFFVDNKHHETFLRASMSEAILTVRGKVRSTVDGIVILDNCELVGR